MLLVVNTFGNGPRLRGYAILDEIFTGLIVAGATLRIMVHSPNRRPDQPAGFQKWAYIGWIVYMVYEACVGIIVNEDLRLIRWVIFYAMLGMLSLILYRRSSEFPFPSSRQVALIISITTTIYYITYLGQGLIGEMIFGAWAGRFLTQDYFWTGSAYAVFPTLTAMPAAIILINEASRKVRALAWGSIALMMAVAFYYDSRISWLVMIAICAVSLRTIRVRRIIAIAFVFLSMAFWSLPNLLEHLPLMGEDLLATSQALWAPQKTDLGRHIQLEAGINAALDDWKTFVFGAGIYSHRFLIVPYIHDLMKWRYQPDLSFMIPGTRDDSGPEVTIFRTVGFSALLIDAGVVGLLLFIVNLLLVARHVLITRTTMRTNMTLVVILAGLWLLSNNILDIIMFHLILMPCGLIEQWARASAASAKVVESPGEEQVVPVAT